LRSVQRWLSPKEAEQAEPGVRAEQALAPVPGGPVAEPAVQVMVARALAAQARAAQVQPEEGAPPEQLAQGLAVVLPT